MSIGEVQFYCQHKVTFWKGDGVKNMMEHVFAYVSWKQKHPVEDYFGISATFCINMFEPESTFCFIPVQPVQRINSICAHSSLNIEISSISETAFIAIPIPLKVS